MTGIGVGRGLLDFRGRMQEGAGVGMFALFAPFNLSRKGASTCPWLEQKIGVAFEKIRPLQS